MNVMNDIAQENNIQIGYYNKENILRIFKLIDQNSPEVDIGRKRMISVNFFLKQLFDNLGIKYKFIPLTRSKNTLNSKRSRDSENLGGGILYSPETNFLAYFFLNFIRRWR